MENSNNLRKRLYQHLLNKEPKQNHLLGSDSHTKSAILKPKVTLEAMNTTAKIMSPVFNRGKIMMENKSPEVPKKIAPIPVKDKISKEGKAIIEEGKLKSKANLKPHDIFSFYEAFPEMSEDFFYLNRSTHPYDYQIVTYSQRNPMEYMTISFKGVTLYHEKEAEFLTKEEWIADEKNYYSLQKIDFFKQYKISKNFTIWKNRMRRHYMKEMSNLLHESLFFSYEYPRHCLLEIRKATNHLKEDTYFMPISTIESLQPNEFKKNAEEYIENHFVEKLKEVENIIADHLEIAIAEEIKKFKLENNIKINDVGDYDQKEQKEGYVYSQEAILRKQYKKVNRLIKLADSILVESKIELLQECLLELIEKIEEVNNSDSKSEWIKCTAQLLENETSINSTKKIEWNPTLDGLKNIFKDIINLAVTKMSDLHEKVGSREKFQKYRPAEENENRKDEKRNTLKYIIEESSFYTELISKINGYLEEEFKKTEKQEGELSKFIEIYTKHKSLPEIKEIFKLHSAAEYIQLVREWREDDTEMHSLPMNKSGGLLIFDYSLLRSVIHDVPKKTLTSFLGQLPEETKKKYNELVNESENHLDQINNYPINMEEFVEFNQAVKNATTALEDLIDGSKSLIQMVALIEENKTPSSDFNKINPKKAIENISKLKAKVDESNAKYDQSLSKFKKELESRVSRVKSSVKELSSKFEVIPFDNISSQIDPTLEKLQEIFPPIKKLEEEALSIQEIEWQLSLPTTELDEIHSLYKKLVDVKNLWECKQKWNELLLQIFHKHYKEIDCNDLKNKWEEFSKKNTDLLKTLPDNEVLKKLIGEISEFENLLEIIVYLTSPNLEEKSWREISEYLAYELNIEDEKSLPFNNRDDPQYTVEWLINNNISLYKEKISFIVQKSQKEKELQTNLSDFKNFISTIVFDTVTKKREVVLIEKSQELHKNIKEKISTLYSLIRNQYSDSLKNEAEVMIKHYEYLEEIMEGMYNFREEWEKYEPFFENNSTSSKLLSKEAKEFSSWELQWKKIIKNITNDPTFLYKKICDETLGVNCSRAILKSMIKANMFLDLVKKGMEEFLEKKRIQFPRYCLFTDEELISILSKVDSRHLIVPEIITILYDNFKSIEYDEESGAVLSVTTYQNEKFPLVKQSAFKIQSEMEDLLKITEDQIKKTMAYTIRSVFNKYIEEEISRESLVVDNHVQVSLQVDFIAWVRLAEETYLINEPVGNMEDWLSIQEQQIREVSSLMKKSSAKDYFKYTQFMVQSIYFREKTKSLKANNVVDTSFYEWERIPKMVMTGTDIHLKQLESKISYNYELLNQKEAVVIQSESEKVWINLTNAISNKEGKTVIGLRGNHAETIKDLAFYVGQSLKSINFSESCNIKTVEKFLTGCMHLGLWMHFTPISNPEILSYIAYHINANKRSTNFESISSTLQLTKSTSLNNSFLNSVFFFEFGEKFIEARLIDPKNFRNITLHEPNPKLTISILCEAEEIPSQIGTTLFTICEFCKETFQFSKSITQKFLRDALREIKEFYLPKLNDKEIKNSETLDFIALYVISEKLSLDFSAFDEELFQAFKVSFLPNYQTLKMKISHRFTEKTLNQIHPVNKFLESLSIKSLYTKEFINQSIKVYDMMKNDHKLGVILSGPIFSGKSETISFIESVIRFEMKNKDNKLEVLKIYPNAYKPEEIVKSYTQEKKDKREKSEKSDRLEKEKQEKVNEDLGILQNFLLRETQEKWLIIDGKIENRISEFLNRRFDEILISNYGLISKEKNHKENLENVHIIIETLNSSDFSPSSFYNFSLYHVPSSVNTVESMIKSFFQKEKTKKYLRGLNEESISYIEQQLIVNLTKVEQKGNIKSKSLEFLYPFADNEITFKCLKLIECVFKLNQESIREKEKNMKKTIERFIHWSILIILYLHVEVESQSKLEKRFMEVCKYDNAFHESVNQYIVYPGSGIEVHPVNGLRTQSSLFEIPEKGIITSITNTDFNEFNNFMNQKTNHFYEEISLETVSKIRVNHDESNLFNYYSQLFAYSNSTIVLTGPTGSGKKSILELYAKNIKHRAFVHSIRHQRNQSLFDHFETSFRKFNSLEGTILKSPSITKDVVILIDDLSLVEEEKETLEFFRMLLNENGFVSKNGKIRNLTQENNNISILSNLIDSEETVNRLCSRLMFFQTSNNSLEKLTSIFLPFLKAWSKANSLEGEVERIFTSSNGDTLLDATLKIFEFMEETFKSKKSQKDFSLNTLLLKPRIGDISRVLSCICLTQDANKLTLGYYSDLWANEIMRVFEDRLSPSQKDIAKNLMEMVKKEFFLKFKENFQYNPKELFIFSSYLSGENRFYERMYDLEHLQQMIENAYESETITVPVKLFFSELLKEVLKIYRVIEITNGHMILFHLNKKVRHYLIELASQVAETPLLQLKQKTLTPEKDIIAILEYEESISVFEDLDDITEEQIYQFTCLLNQNFYDFDLKPETREKIKIKVTKYLRKLLNEVNVAKESNSQSQKVKTDNNKEKETLYINQKLDDELESTMQEVMMNSVHFLFGASPINTKTKRLLLNETDFVGEMHFSFFDISDESIMEISKQILTLEDLNESMEKSEQTAKAKQNTQEFEKEIETIKSKCIRIYESLPETERDYNALLTVCENIMTARTKLKEETQIHINQLQKCLENHSKALQLISENEIKLEKSIFELEEIKKHQTALSEKLEEITNEINELQLNLNENEEESHENSEKKLLLEERNQEFEQIENDLKEIKIKKDKNDVETREARKMIQLSKDYLEIVMDVEEVEKKLEEQKQIFANIENLLTLWWSLIIYSSNAETEEMIDQLNLWMGLINFKENFIVKNCEDILSMFELLIAPLAMVIPALGSIESWEKLKVIILMFIIYRHDETPSENRIISLYDPYKVYPSILKFFPVDSELGNFSLAQTIHKYDDEFWTEIEKHKRGIIFLDHSIDPRQKKEIESHIVKRRLFQLNRFVYLVDKKEKADVSFVFDKKYFINHLKLLSMLTDDTTSALDLIKTREDYMKETKKLKEMKKNLRIKIADIKFEMETDTEEFSRFQRDVGLLENKISEHKIKVSLQNLKVTEERMITKIIDELHKHVNLCEKNPHEIVSVFNLQTIEKLYRTLKEHILRFVSDLREKEAELLEKKNLLEKPVLTAQIERKSVRPSMNSIEIPSQFMESLSKSQFEFTKDEQEKVDVMIEKLIRDNFSEHKKLERREMFNIDLLSLEILSKIPIVIVENNLINQGFINRDNRPINLLYSCLSNVLLESPTSNSNEERVAFNNKVFLFYNDKQHYNILLDLINKYRDEFNSTNKKHCIYLFTNLPFPLLIEGESRPESNYRIFYCDENSCEKVDEVKSLQNLPLSEKSSKEEMFIKLLEHLSKSKSYNHSSIERYSEFLLTKIPPNIDESISLAQSELKNYLLDVGFDYDNEENLLEKILNDHITPEEINAFIEKDIAENSKLTNNSFAFNIKPLDAFTTNKTLEKEIRRGDLEIRNDFSQDAFEEISEEIPNIFKISEFLVPVSKDFLSFEFENIAKIFNLKVEKVKSLLQRNLKICSFGLNKLSSSYLESGTYVVPTKKYIHELNQEFKGIKKLLIQNGLLAGTSSSMGKIVSTKGLNATMSSDSNKHGMFLDSIDFSTKMLDELKIRACKKLKIEYSRLGILLVLDKKPGNYTYSTPLEKLIANTPVEIMLSMNAELINAQFKDSTPIIRDQKINEEEKTTKHKRESLRSFCQTKRDENKLIRLLVIPYDTNTFNDTHNYFVPVNNENQFNVSMKKKTTIFGDTIMKKEETMKEKNSVEICKLKVFICENEVEESEINRNGKELGVIEIPMSELYVEYKGISNPSVEIRQKVE